MPPRRQPPGRPRPASRSVISTALRNLLTSGEHSLFAVARDSGVPLSSLTRFASGERDLKLASVDAVADVLGLKLVETGRDRVRPSRSPRPACRSPLSPRETPGVSAPAATLEDGGADL